jgi:hypothetical protein
MQAVELYRGDSGGQGFFGRGILAFAASILLIVPFPS